MPVKTCLGCPAHKSTYKAEKELIGGGKYVWHRKLVSVTCQELGGVTVSSTGMDKKCRLPEWGEEK